VAWNEEISFTITVIIAKLLKEFFTFEKFIFSLNNFSYSWKGWGGLRMM
jgi:hypothetical protein